jgi:16S rRNA A1518/A1519 N6-dimethyltransferase RsmA/KsgA/DIM1 with predicted DNA glycosylase/AP lyase activity
MARKRIRLAQNFLRDPQLVKQSVESSSLTKDDLILEIGPGEGIITNELARNGRKIIAIEKDNLLAAQLKKRLEHKRNVEVLEGDFLQFSFPTLKTKRSWLTYSVERDDGEILSGNIIGEDDAKPCQRKKSRRTGLTSRI